MTDKHHENINNGGIAPTTITTISKTTTIRGHPVDPPDTCIHQQHQKDLLESTLKQENYKNSTMTTKCNSSKCNPTRRDDPTTAAASFAAIDGNNNRDRYDRQQPRPPQPQPFQHQIDPYETTVPRQWPLWWSLPPNPAPPLITSTNSAANAKES